MATDQQQADRMLAADQQAHPRDYAYYRARAEAEADKANLNRWHRENFIRNLITLERQFSRQDADRAAVR